MEAKARSCRDFTGAEAGIPQKVRLFFFPFFFPIHPPFFSHCDSFFENSFPIFFFPAYCHFSSFNLFPSLPPASPELLPRFAVAVLLLASPRPLIICHDATEPLFLTPSVGNMDGDDIRRPGDEVLLPGALPRRAEGHRRLFPRK